MVLSGNTVVANLRRIQTSLSVEKMIYVKGLNLFDFDTYCEIKDTQRVKAPSNKTQALTKFEHLRK